jgi:hypothetical protein
VIKNIENTIKDWFTAWNTHNARIVAQFYNDDSVFEDYSHRLFCHGTNEIYKAVDLFFIGIHDMKVEPKNSFISGSFACSECIFSGVQTVSDVDRDKSLAKKSFSVPMVFVSEWQNGKIKRHAIYHDQLSVMQQLGLIPSMPLK